jgi:hypothetical protein
VWKQQQEEQRTAFHGLHTKQLLLQSCSRCPSVQKPWTDLQLIMAWQPCLLLDLGLLLLPCCCPVRLFDWQYLSSR